MISREEFLNNIFAEKNEDELICVSRSIPKTDGEGVWFKNYLLDDRQWRKWQPETQDQSWYFCVSTITGDMNEKRTMVRRGRAQLIRAHCLVLDDIGTKGSAPPVSPSWKLESSPGNQQWGYQLEPTDNFAQYEALVEHCHLRGWGDAGAGGSYRIMRVPGSYNSKPGRSFKSDVTFWDDVYWSLDDLATALDFDLSAVPVANKTVARLGGAQALEGVDIMLNWLNAENHVVKDGGDWIDVVCPWADSHTSGANTAGYSPLGRGGEDWVQTRAFKCLHEHCLNRKLDDFVKWAEKLGGPYVSGYDPLPWLQDRYAYIGMGQQIVDLYQRKMGGEWIWELADWAKRHPGRVAIPGEDTKLKVSDAFVASRNTCHVDYTYYLPVSRTEDTGVLTIKGQQVLNMYTPPNWKETNELPEMFIEHMNYLIPCDAEREIFINWLAYKFQYPDRRSYGVLMVADGVFGTGRSWLRRMLANTLQGKVNSATLSQLIGRGTSSEQNYNDWQARCAYLIVEEAKEVIDRDVFYQAYETFKTNVDPAVGVDVRINPKFGRTRTENIYYNALIFSNHKDAIALPANDRRLYVIQNPKEMATQEYYERLAASIHSDEPRRLYWWLMNRDVDQYDNIYPPMTPGKLAMIEQNSAPSDEIWAHIIENSTPDLVTKNSLKRIVVNAATMLDFDNIAMKPDAVTRALWGKCWQLRDEVNGARYYLNGAQRVVKALRNLEKWTEIDKARDKELIEEGVKG